MVDTSKSNKEDEWGKHIVAVVDLLGQSRLLKEEPSAKLDKHIRRYSIFGTCSMRSLKEFIV